MFNVPTLLIMTTMPYLLILFNNLIFLAFLCDLYFSLQTRLQVPSQQSMPAAGGLSEQAMSFQEDNHRKPLLQEWLQLWEWGVQHFRARVRSISHCCQLCSNWDTVQKQTFQVKLGHVATLLKRKWSRQPSNHDLPVWNTTSPLSSSFLERFQPMSP